MASLFGTLLALYLAKLAWSEPTLTFPFNAQLPPVARINQLFSYSFSPHTFQSGSNLTYALGNHPGWLSIESDGRRLYGTPREKDVPPGDVVGQLVDIVASDHTGSTSMNATLVVSRNKAPAVQIPLSEQIENLGEFSTPSSILSYPSTDFTYTFDPNTFGTAQNLNYYAASNDSSPLPAWIRFNAASLTFSGRTPAFESLVQPPQKFDFSLVASDIVGFSGVSLSFSIVVGSHKLTTDSPMISLNATRDSELRSDNLENGIKLDGKPVPTGHLNVSTDGMPSWLSYDTKTRRLSGTPDNDSHSTNFTVNFSDRFADTLSVLIEIKVATGLFKSTFEDIQIQPDDEFNLDLKPYFQDPEDIKVKVDTDPQESWLKVDGFKIFGRVPKTSKGEFNLSVKATSKSSGLTETEVIHASFLALGGTITTSTSSSGSPTSKPTMTNSADADAVDSPPGRLSTGEILLATIIPILFLALVIMFAVCFMRRRRHRQTYLSGKYREKISGPVPSSLRINGSAAASIHHVENMPGMGQPEMPLFKTGKGVCAEVTSQASSRPRTSETLGNASILGAPPGVMASGARSATIRSVSIPVRDDERDSWVTVDGVASITKSNRSTGSLRSDTTLPEGAQPFLPPSGYFTDAEDGTFGSGLDLMISSLGDLPSLQPMPPVTQPSRRRPSAGAYSTTTSSSAALPSSPSNSQRAHTKGRPRRPRKSSTGLNWEALADSKAAESVSELRRPEQVQLSSHQWLSRQGPSLHDGESINDNKSFETEQSFGSSENWRIIGRRDPSVVYKDIVADAPFNPSSPISPRDGAQPGERHSMDLMSPSKWGDDEQKSTTEPQPLTSIVSKMTEDDASVFGEREAVERATKAAWNRDESKATVGSFKMFI